MIIHLLFFRLAIDSILRVREKKLLTQFYRVIPLITLGFLDSELLVVKVSL
jgi:hypothetical protein